MNEEKMKLSYLEWEEMEDTIDEIIIEASKIHITAWEMRKEIARLRSENEEE